MTHAVRRAGSARRAARDSDAPRAWQRMLSGRRLDLLDPSPLDIELSDIAHGLARVARWNGQTRGAHAFSVAQHSLLVETIFGEITGSQDPVACQLALLHDAPEYVIGDMISPFKAVVGGDYKAVEARLAAAIRLRFSLPGTVSRSVQAAIKSADQIAAFFEATELAGFDLAEAERYFGKPEAFHAADLPIEPMSTTGAETAFLSRFNALDAQRGAG